MATFSLVLWKYRKDRFGKYPIFLRITEGRKPRYIKTGISIDEKHWNENAQDIRKSHPNYKPLNSKLKKIKTGAQNTEISLQKKPEDTVTADKIKQEVKGQNRRDFKIFAQEYIDQLDERDQYWQWKKVRVVVSKVKEFAKEYQGEGPLYFDEITPRFLESFQTWLQTEKKNNHNTRYKNLSVFRQIIRQAVKEKIIIQSENPFISFPLSKKKVRKKKLSIKEIEKIQDTDPPPGSGVWHAKNYFLFSFYCAGVRFGDLACLKWKNIEDGRLKYEMNKTGAYKNIQLLPGAEKILDHYKPDIVNPEVYIFPLLDNNTKYISNKALKKQISSCNSRVNQDLKNLMDKAEVKTNISFHIARHSFADYARQRGMDLYSLSKALGHSSLTITEQYLKSFDAEQLDEAMGKVFENGRGKDEQPKSE